MFQLSDEQHDMSSTECIVIYLIETITEGFENVPHALIYSTEYSKRMNVRSEDELQKQK